MARKGLPASVIRQAGGNLKKAWSLYRGGARSTGSVKSTAAKKGRARRYAARARSYAGRGSKLLGQYGAAGAVEDLAIGYFGSSLLMSRGYPIEQAMPMTRVGQGAVMKALGRRGGGRLVYGLLDLVDVYLLKRGFNLQTISLGAWR